MTTSQEFARRRWIALALLCFAQFIVVLDASIVNVALPSIGKGLDFSQQNLAWVVNAYVLTFGGFLLLGGRMADLLGRRRVFIVGLLLVAAASLAVGYTPLRRRRCGDRHRRPLDPGIRDRRRDQRRLGLVPHARLDRAVCGADRGLHRDRAPLASAADAVPDLPQPDPHGRQHRRAP